MPLLSLFMTSTGIFCFVPISQRLVESGIMPASNGRRFRRLPFVLAPTFYVQKGGLRLQFAADETDNAWSETEERHQIQSPRIPLYSVDDTLSVDQQPATPANEWNADMISPRACSPADSLLQSTPIDMLHGRECTSFISNNTLCDNCNTLLQREIPPDHIPSVIRALALFEAQDRFSDVGFSECDMVALTNAFAMLQL